MQFIWERDKSGVSWWRTLYCGDHELLTCRPCWLCSCCCDQIPDRINLRMERYISAHSSRGFLSILAGKTFIEVGACARGCSHHGRTEIREHDRKLPSWHPPRSTCYQLSAARPHLLHGPQPAKTVLSAREQVLNAWVCVGHFRFRP